MGKTQKQFEADYQDVECRECGTHFNIGEQPYYDNLCPKCKWTDE